MDVKNCCYNKIPENYQPKMLVASAAAAIISLVALALIFAGVVTVSSPIIVAVLIPVTALSLIAAIALTVLYLVSKNQGPSIPPIEERKSPPIAISTHEVIHNKANSDDDFGLFFRDLTELLGAKISDGFESRLTAQEKKAVKDIIREILHDDGTIFGPLFNASYVKEWLSQYGLGENHLLENFIINIIPHLAPLVIQPVSDSIPVALASEEEIGSFQNKVAEQYRQNSVNGEYIPFSLDEYGTCRRQLEQRALNSKSRVEYIDRVATWVAHDFYTVCYNKRNPLNQGKTTEEVGRVIRFGAYQVDFPLQTGMVRVSADLDLRRFLSGENDFKVFYLINKFLYEITNGADDGRLQADRESLQAYYSPDVVAEIEGVLREFTNSILTQYCQVFCKWRTHKLRPLIEKYSFLSQ